jgi:hypothetical protein
MAGAAIDNLFIGWIVQIASGKSRNDLNNTIYCFEISFNAPKTAACYD